VPADGEPLGAGLSRQARSRRQAQARISSQAAGQINGCVGIHRTTATLRQAAISRIFSAASQPSRRAARARNSAAIASAGVS
jgi:hypothetical protein